jgi:hypothetical protein
MKSSVQLQIDWIKKEILDQVDAGIENFTLVESGDDQVLAYAKVIVNAIIGKIDVSHALDYYYYIVDEAVDKNTWTSSPDRLQCIYDYFNQWTELELAKRYA